MASERARAGGGQEVSLSPYDVKVSYRARIGEGASWFGPLDPMTPQAPAAVEGRQFDFPSGYNLVQTPRSYEAIGFPALRSLADSYDLLRIIIETRKDQISRLGWNVIPRDPRVQLEGDIAERAKQVEAFFVRPDRQHFWDEWLRMVLEDLLVIDAPAVYRRRTRGGDLYALEPIDGATIKRVIDDWGRTPEEGPAYQQVLKGLPAVDYTAQDLLYRPRNLRTHKIYGYSPVEQIIMTVNIALRRQIFQLSYFTEGNVPEALIGVPETWTPDQIRQFQVWFDSVLQGNLAERSRARFVPNAVGKTYIETKAGELFGKAEEWMARVTCFAFSISPAPFVTVMNRASAETAAEEAAMEGLSPLQNWIRSLVDTVIIEDFGYTDLRFAWEEDDEIDPAKKQTLLSGYVSDGIMTINEARAKAGLDPDPDPVFNKLMFKSSMGYVDIVGGPIPTNAQTMVGEEPADGTEDEEETEETPEGSKEGVAKSTVPFADPDRKKNKKAIRRLETRIEEVLGEQRTRIAELVASAVDLADTEKLAKAEDPQWLEILIGQLEASLATLQDAFIDELEAVAVDTAAVALARLGPNVPDELTNQVNARARDWARSRAAELVSEAGNATRDFLRATITAGLSEGLSAEAIASKIESDYAFSPERARVIAETEVARANSWGAVEGYREARESGVNVRKSWLRREDACPVCTANEEQGIIDLDELFQSGDDAPPAHPNCRCVIVPHVEE